MNRLPAHTTHNCNLNHWKKGRTKWANHQWQWQPGNWGTGNPNANGIAKESCKRTSSKQANIPMPKVALNKKEKNKKNTGNKNTDKNAAAGAITTTMEIPMGQDKGVVPWHCVSKRRYPGKRFFCNSEGILRTFYCTCTWITYHGCLVAPLAFIVLRDFLIYSTARHSQINALSYYAKLFI